MQWSAFVGALVGAFVAIVTVLGAFVVWDWLTQRREKAARLRPSAESLLERDLEEHIVRHFALLFPGWSIYFGPDGASIRPSGVRYAPKLAR
jgi:hypothetical protein